MEVNWFQLIYNLSSHHLQREAREAKQQQMANEPNNPIIPANEEEVVDEGNIFVGDFMTPQSFKANTASCIHRLGSQISKWRPTSYTYFRMDVSFMVELKKTNIRTSLDS